MVPNETEKARDEALPTPMYQPDNMAQSISAGVYGWLPPVLFALTLLFVISTFFGRLIGVEGRSMVPTLHDKDMLILQSIGYSPKRGDIVVLSEHTFRDGTPIVKRVIATEGERVDLDYDAHTVTVTGADGASQVLDEPYLDPNDPMRDNPWAVNNHVTVPEGEIFVLGDNRNNSTDSRSASVGTVDVRCVLGKAVWRLVPFGGIYG